MTGCQTPRGLHSAALGALLVSLQSIAPGSLLSALAQRACLSAPELGGVSSCRAIVKSQGLVGCGWVENSSEPLAAVARVSLRGQPVAEPNEGHVQRWHEVRVRGARVEQRKPVAPVSGHCPSAVRARIQATCRCKESKQHAGNIIGCQWSWEDGTTGYTSPVCGRAPLMRPAHLAHTSRTLLHSTSALTMREAVHS